jgi:ketosteroid isomerase-like protein
LSVTAVRELWLSDTITSDFTAKLRNAKPQVAHLWTIRDGRAVKFQQYLDTLQVARDAGGV